VACCAAVRVGAACVGADACCVGAGTGVGL
jgi:hypothetical protein